MGVPVSDALLVLNAGSSSIKFALFDVPGAVPRLELHGQIEELQGTPHFAAHAAGGEVRYEHRERHPAPRNGQGERGADVDQQNQGQVFEVARIAVVGHQDLGDETADPEEQRI